ncbi:MAG: hypothetical protein ACOYXM_07620 [Actinomycetota bacterium]
MEDRRSIRDPQFRLEQLVHSLGSYGAADLSSFRGAEVKPWMADALRSGEAGLRRLRRQVEARLADVERRCTHCGREVAGRADRLYCSNRCKVAACRARANQ